MEMLGVGMVGREMRFVPLANAEEEVVFGGGVALSPNVAHRIMIGDGGFEIVGGMVITCAGSVPSAAHSPRRAAPSAPPASPAMSWQQRLTMITRQYRQAEIETFLEQVASPALQGVATQMRSEGLEPRLLRSQGSIELLVPQPAGAFSYRIRNRSLRAASFTWAEAPRMRDEVDRHFRAMAQGSDGQHRDVTGFSAEQLIQDLLTRLARFRDGSPHLPA